MQWSSAQALPARRLLARCRPSGSTTSRRRSTESGSCIRYHNRLKAHIFFTSRIPGLVFLCRADKHHYKRCKSPFTVRLSSAPGKGKAHRIQVIAVDPATGKRSKPKTIKFRIVRKTRR